MMFNIPRLDLCNSDYSVGRELCVCNLFFSNFMCSINFLSSSDNLSLGYILTH